MDNSNRKSISNRKFECFDSRKFLVTGKRKITRAKFWHQLIRDKPTFNKCLSTLVLKLQKCQNFVIRKHWPSRHLRALSQQLPSKVMRKHPSTIIISRLLTHDVFFFIASVQQKIVRMRERVTTRFVPQQCVEMRQKELK